ncbi:MAG: ATP-binding protein [Paracoccaceae bacterium]
MLAEETGLPLMSDPAQYSMTSDPVAVRDGLHMALQHPPLALLSAADRGTAEIVLAEVLNNIVEHAYAAETGPIRLCLSLGDARLICRIEDEGAPMPGATPPAGHPPDPVDLPEGGFGWHLIRSLSLDLGYERDGRTNRLYFTLPVEQSCG